jgi:hypothetical protein
MMCYRDMTFCPFWEDCANADECPRPLTPEVQKGAVAWWGDPNPPIAMFVYKPECHRLKEESNEV